MARLHDYRRRQDKYVVFTELGYNRSTRAPYEPWSHDSVAGREAEGLQVLCLSSALHAVEAEKRVFGSFLWKWFPGEKTPQNFAMSSPAMRGVIARYWRDYP